VNSQNKQIVHFAVLT